MRILIDENAPVQLVAPLTHLLPGHEVAHVAHVKWSGKKDLAVLADAAARGFEVFLTKDSRQLDDPDETTAIKKSRLHHVRYSQTHRRMPGLGLAMGVIIGAMPLLVPELAAADSQRLVHIKGLDPTARRRYDVADPRKDPPRYWPR